MEEINQEKLNDNNDNNDNYELERRRDDASLRIDKFKSEIMKNFSKEEQEILERNIQYLNNLAAESNEFNNVSRNLWLNKEGSGDAVIKLLTDFSKSVIDNIKESSARDFIAILLKNGKSVLQEKFWGTPSDVLDFKILKDAFQKIENIDVLLIQKFAASVDFKDVNDFYKMNEQIILAESGHSVAEEFYKKLSDALLKLFIKKEKLVSVKADILEKKGIELKSVKVKVKDKEGNITEREIKFEESCRGWEQFGFAPGVRIIEKQTRYKDNEEVNKNPIPRLGFILGVDRDGNLKYLRDGGIKGTGSEWTLRVKDKDKILDFIELVSLEQEAEIKLKASEIKRERAREKEKIDTKDIILTEITEKNKEDEFKRFNRLHNDINNKFFSYIYRDDEISKESKDAIKAKINEAGEILTLGLRNIAIQELKKAFEILKEANEDINKILGQKQEAKKEAAAGAEEVAGIEEIENELVAAFTEVLENFKKYEIIKDSKYIADDYKKRLFTQLEDKKKRLEEIKAMLFK